MDSFNHWNNLADVLHDACVDAVQETAKNAKENIQQTIAGNGQVSTWFMHDSVYVVDKDGSDYAGGEKALPEVDPPENDTTAYVAVAAEYGIYQNNGTRYLPARPFFEPGMQKTAPEFDRELRGIEDKFAAVS